MYYRMMTVHVEGRTAKEVEFKTLSTGTEIATLDVAVYVGKDKAGNSKSIFVKVEFWHPTDVKNLHQYPIKKGTEIRINGHIEGDPNAWIAKNTGEAKAQYVVRGDSYYVPFSQQQNNSYQNNGNNNYQNNGGNNYQGNGNVQQNNSYQNNGNNNYQNNGGNNYQGNGNVQQSSYPTRQRQQTQPQQPQAEQFESYDGDLPFN